LPHLFRLALYKRPEGHHYNSDHDVEFY